ncbi:hypothetical protein GF312_00580 [Candidatus Poribacteria bacterium]|nr:hypothetical protein [Candidatus Poribacteria bacterium]
MEETTRILKKMEDTTQLRMIAEKVAETLEVPVELIYTTLKLKKATQAREITFYILRRLNISNREIAREFGLNEPTVTTTYQRGEKKFLNADRRLLTEIILKKIESTDQGA